MRLLLELVFRGGAEAVVIDEFTHWVRASPRVLSEMQELVDQSLPRYGNTLVITGFVMGVIMSEVLGAGPLCTGGQPLG